MAVLLENQPLLTTVASSNAISKWSTDSNRDNLVRRAGLPPIVFLAAAFETEVGKMMLHNSGTTGVRHNFLLPGGHSAWVIHNLLLTCSSKAFSQAFKVICKLRVNVPPPASFPLFRFYSSKLLNKRAWGTLCPKRLLTEWGLYRNFTLKCEHLYLSFCSLMQLEFYEVSQRYYELEKNCLHLTDEWTKHREVRGRGGSFELQQTQSVGTLLSSLTANLPPSQVLCWASTFSQTDRFQTFYELFAFFFLRKVICVHQVQLR